MHLVHLISGNFKRESGGVCLQRLDIFPADLGVRYIVLDSAGKTLSKTLIAEASEQSAKTDIYREYAELVIQFTELYIINPDDFGAVHINDLFVKEVALDEDISNFGQIFGQAVWLDAAG